MRKSLKVKVTELLHFVTECELKANECNEPRFKKTIEFQLIKLITEIKGKEYTLDLTTNDNCRLDCIVYSSLNSSKELGEELLSLIFGADERARYFES